MCPFQNISLRKNWLAIIVTFIYDNHTTKTDSKLDYDNLLLTVSSIIHYFQYMCSHLQNVKYSSSIYRLNLVPILKPIPRFAGKCMSYLCFAGKCTSYP